MKNEETKTSIEKAAQAARALLYSLDEERARKIISDAMRMNTSIIESLNSYRASEGVAPRLTEIECMNIAVNYHFSWRDIRDIFEKRI